MPSIFVGIDGIGRLMGISAMFEWMHTMVVERKAEERFWALEFNLRLRYLWMSATDRSFARKQEMSKLRLRTE
jgi:hypothetical protein